MFLQVKQKACGLTAKAVSPQTEKKQGCENNIKCFLTVI
jgi:hypothetical protein